jgi:hypothetical protein
MKRLDTKWKDKLGQSLYVGDWIVIEPDNDYVNPKIVYKIRLKEIHKVKVFYAGYSHVAELKSYKQQEILKLPFHKIKDMEMDKSKKFGTIYKEKLL